MATTETERKRNAVAGALAGFRMGKAPDRSGEKQVGDEAFYKRQHEKGQELGSIVGDLTGWNAWKRLMSTPYDTLMGSDADAVGRAGLDAAQVAGTAMVGSMPMERPAGALFTGLPVAPAGKPGKALGKIARGAGPSSEELLQTALETPRKGSVRGGYVGAPPSVGTPEAENALIGDILHRLKGYKGNGTNFYDEFQNAIRNWTSKPETAQRFATASGHTSNQMSPLPNTTHALKAMNQAATGAPIKAGLYPNASGAKIAEDFAAGTMSADPKTGQYTYHLLPEEMRPVDFGDYAFGGERAVSPGRAVHDTWDKEAFGYPRNPAGKQNAASDTEHLFMDRIYNKVVRAARRDPELRARLGTGTKTYERAQADLWDIERRKKEKFDVLPADKIMSENSALTQVAAIPGPSTGISRQLLDAPLPVKEQYTDEMMNAWSDGAGRNAPAAALGMTAPMEKGLGQWDGMMEPNRAVRYGIGTVGSGAEKAIDPASREAMGAVLDWNQIGLGQEGGGITAGRTDGATRAAGDLAVIGAPLRGPADYDPAFKAVRDAFGPDWQYNVVVQPGKNGEVVLKNIGGIPGDQFHKLAGAVSQAMGAGKPGVERDVGNTFRMVGFDQPGGSPHLPEVWQRPEIYTNPAHADLRNPNSYHRLFDRTRENPNLKDTFDTEVVPKLADVQSVSNKWEAEQGIPANTVVDRLRRIITGAGPNWPQAIDAAVKKGLIPTVALPLLYSAGRQFDSEGGTQP